MTCEKAQNYQRREFREKILTDQLSLDKLKMIQKKNIILPYSALTDASPRILIFRKNPQKFHPSLRGNQKSSWIIILDKLWK